MKLKLFLIITALLASYPANTFAEDFDDECVEFVDSIFNVNFVDDSIYHEEALLLGDSLPWDGTTIAPVEEVDGVYHIYNGAQLAWIAEQVNTPDKGGMSDCVISIEADINLNGFNWTPIGCSYETPFAGTVNGNGFSVYNFTFDASSYTHGGLFGCVIGTISNLGVETTDGGITTSRHVTPSGSNSTKNGIGILAGSLDARNFDYNTKDYVGVIEDCIVKGSLTVSNSYGEAYYVGGIVGMNSGGELYRNISEADISVQSDNSNGTDEAYVGGIAGFNTGKLGGIWIDSGINLDWPPNRSTATEASGKISVSSANPSAGAVAGGNSGSISGSSATGNFLITKQVSVYDDNYANVGGIVGYNKGIIEYSAHSENISLSISNNDDNSQLNIGGIAGISAGELTEDGEIISEAIITDCLLNESDITVDAAIKRNIGGIVGMCKNAAVTVTDCESHGTVNVTSSLHRICAGGISGVTYGVTDSCSSDVKLNIVTSVSVSAGGIAGVSYNTVSDCITSSNNASIRSDSPTALIYYGGISGEAYGRLRRCIGRGSALVSGPLSYAGGIAGRAELNNEKSIITGDGEGFISKCTSEKHIKCTNIGGGIVGDAYNIIIQRSAAIKTDVLEGANISGAVGAGGIAGRAGSTAIENCMVSAYLTSTSNAGAVYEYSNSDNTINMSYFTPEMLGEVSHPISIAETAKYATTRSYLNTDVSKVESVEGITAVTNESAALRSTFAELNFTSVWAMTPNGPVLQHTVNSNAINSVREITETKMHFNVSLENPGVGQKVYVALYDIDNRFCGTVSAVCTEENINSTATRADFALEYSYSYWDLDEWWNTGEWVASKGLPFSYKAFTWDEENGMRSLSSVEEGILTYYFE